MTDLNDLPVADLSAQIASAVSEALIKNSENDVTELRAQKELSIIRWLMGGGAALMAGLFIFIFQLGSGYSDIKNEIQGLRSELKAYKVLNEDRLKTIQSITDENKLAIKSQMKEDRETIRSIENKLNELGRDMATVKAQLGKK